ARKVRIGQMLIPCRLRHVLQHAEPLLNRPLPLRWKLLPSGKHFILYMALLIRPQPVPVSRGFLHLLLLSGIQLLIIPIVTYCSLLFLWIQAVEVSRRSIRRRSIQILLIPRPLRRTIDMRRHGLGRSRRTIRIVIPSLFSPFLTLLLSLLLARMRLVLRRPV